MRIDDLDTPSGVFTVRAFPCVNTEGPLRHLKGAAHQNMPPQSRSAPPPRPLFLVKTRKPPPRRCFGRRRPPREPLVVPWDPASFRAPHGLRFVPWHRAFFQWKTQPQARSLILP